jgi:hypothetical protein
MKNATKPQLKRFQTSMPKTLSGVNKQSSETHFSLAWRFFKPSLSPARTRFKEITHWAKIGFC